jgi:calcium and integrin-binding protein 1
MLEGWKEIEGTGCEPSDASPPWVRAEWAFKVFDCDGDSLLGRQDIRQVVDAVTGPDMRAFGEQQREDVVSNVLK